MAAHYVSVTNGDDGTGDGTIGTPWASVGEAIDSTLSPGDVVWIAPGVYAESLTLADAGTNGDPILFKGDPNLTEAWTGETKGPVIISAAAGSGVGTSSAATDALDFNGIAYTQFWDLHLMGADDYGAKGSDHYGQTLIRCVIQAGTVACYKVVCDYCVAHAGYRAYYFCAGDTYHGYVTNSVGYGGMYAFDSSDVEQCIAMAGYIGYYEATIGFSRACAAVGCYYGWRQLNSTSSDNLAHACYGGIYDTGGTEIGGLLSRYSYYSYYASSWDCGALGELNCYTENSSVAAAKENMVRVPSAMETIRGLSRALMIEQWGEDSSSWTVGATPTYETTDIEGRRRTVETSSFQNPGPWSYNQRTISGDDKITVGRLGDEVIYVMLPEDNQLTISVDVTCGLDGGSVYPQIVLEGDGLTTQTDTATSTDETLTVTVAGSEPTQDTVARLLLKAREDNSGAWAEFENITVQ